MSRESNRTRMILLIGRPVLNGQWHNVNFLTRDITRQERLRNVHYQVHTYLVAPFFDAPTAQQLLSTIDYTTLYLFVSFLELDYQQCTTIVDGITTVFDNLPDHVQVINFRLEREMDNPEHQDAYEQIRDLLRRHHIPDWLIRGNSPIEATSQLGVEGDTGHEEDGMVMVAERSPSPPRD